MSLAYHVWPKPTETACRRGRMIHHDRLNITHSPRCYTLRPSSETVRHWLFQPHAGSLACRWQEGSCELGRRAVLGHCDEALPIPSEVL